MKQFAIFVVLYCFVLMEGAAAGEQNLLDEVTNQPGIEADLKRDAVRWLEAVRAGNVKALVSFALPEARASVKEQMTQKDALLSSMLLNGATALRKFLNAQPERVIVLLRHRDLIDLGNGTTVCYYRAESVPKVLPGSPSELPDFTSPASVFCTFWTRDHARWYVSYSFGEDEDGA